MKLLRLLPALAIGLAAALAVLAWGARATEASGSITTRETATFPPCSWAAA
jgi:hypothetical protein